MSGQLSLKIFYFYPYISIFSRHEHIYHKVQANMIRSDEFNDVGPSRFKDCQVMLCTLSMLSNWFMRKFTHHIPMKSLIVDEASQIEVGNYISVFSTFQNLRKACFIGDDKQCKYLSPIFYLSINIALHIDSATIWPRGSPRSSKYF
jgi:hypothetical protein